ncbi:hypothetical protein BUALT_Bualt18G0065800 [Buddleja alternifolia]|uniref:Uncharacterized protein n=1 Tax=Buddleja alternifolia TaxID=168488 RepID=A0AAV6W3U2_9LAMI|nr:hypothetical protein BUALT_Bualt18G0065800 [Buddleja alternifolia]
MCNRARNVIPRLLRNVDRLEPELRILRQREKRAWLILMVCLLIFVMILLNEKSGVPKSPSVSMKQLPV